MGLGPGKNSVGSTDAVFILYSFWAYNFCVSKRAKIISAAVVLLMAFVIVFHFVPVDSRTGYLVYSQPTSCPSDSSVASYRYRWVTGGVNTWDDRLSHLREGTNLPGNLYCAEPAHLQLYLF